jgi:hypothetical protein
VDRFGTILDLLDLADPEEGMMVGYGRLRGLVVPPGELIAVALGPSGYWVIRRLTSGAWEKLSDHPVSAAAGAAMKPGLDDAAIRPLLRAGERLFTYLTHWGQSSGVVFGSVNAHYSDDWGATWTPLPLHGVGWLAVDANGTTLYALHNATADSEGGGSLAEVNDAISRSTDGGLTWTRMSDLGAGFIGSSAGASIAMSQDMSQLLILAQGDGLRKSSDGGATFGANYGPVSHTHFAYSGATARTPGDDATAMIVYAGGSTFLYTVPDGAPGTQHDINVLTHLGTVLTVGGVVYAAGGPLKYSTNDGASFHLAAALPGVGRVVSLATDPAGGPLFAGGTPSGTTAPGTSYPAYFTYNLDADEWLDITATHLADLGGMYYPEPYGMVVRPGGGG